MEKTVSIGTLGILTLILLILVTTAPSVIAATANATDTVTVAVTIDEKSIVDINPAILNWSTPIEPGKNGTHQDIQIENMGSVNITNVWFNVTQPSAGDPFGSAISTKYDAGNFIAISEDGQNDYYFVDRLEWNATSRIIYLTLPAANLEDYGRFRNSSFEYFWALTHGGKADNCTNGTIYIGTTAHTQTQTGDTDLTDNGETITNVDGNWGYANVSIGGMFMCAAVNRICEQVRAYKWNMDAPGASSCDNAEYFHDGTASGEVAPGSSVYANVRPHVPYGVYYNSSATYPGQITGTLTVLVATD
jgi:hypothetical protein